MNEDIMRKLGFGKEVDLVKEGKCPMCSQVVDQNDFKDTINHREFKISGICQECQDQIFSGKE